MARAKTPAPPPASEPPPASAPRTFGQRVIDALVPRHFPTLSALSHATGFAYSTIHNWSTGKAVPKLEQLDTISRLLRVDVIDLLRGEANDTGRGRACDRPGWPAAVERAKARHPGKLPDYAYDYAGQTGGASLPEAITDDFAYDLAQFWYKHAANPELALNERERVEAEMAEEDTRHGRAPRGAKR